MHLVQSNLIHNRALVRIAMRDENGEWRRFHNEEIQNSYRSPNSLED